MSVKSDSLMTHPLYKPALRGFLLGTSIGCSIFFPTLQSAIALLWTLMAFELLTSFKGAQMSAYAGKIGLLCAMIPYFARILSQAVLDPLMHTLPLTNNSPRIAVWILGACGLGSFWGFSIAKQTSMTALPQLMALFHSLVGLSATAISLMLAWTHLSSTTPIAPHVLVEIFLGGAVGAITFTGSVFSVLRLQNIVRYAPSIFQFALLSAAGLFAVTWTGWSFFTHPHLLHLSLAMVAASYFGILMILPVAGADMPLIISLLNSCSGWACVSLGVYSHHPLLIVVGSVVGFSGAVLTAVMCRGMNRSLFKVFTGGFAKTQNHQKTRIDQPIQSISAQESAFFLKTAERVLIIPGYGAAVSQAQGPLQELALLLQSQGAEVKYGMHSVAGRMPGHMDILLAQANVPLEDMLELEDANRMLPETDVVLIVGANDTVNPSAEEDAGTDIYGMPIFKTYLAKKVLFIKRSMNTGYSGIDNPLCYMNQTYMVFGDAKKVCEDILKAFSQF